MREESTTPVQRYLRAIVFFCDCVRGDLAFLSLRGYLSVRLCLELGVSFSVSVVFVPVLVLALALALMLAIVLVLVLVLVLVVVIGASVFQFFGHCCVSRTLDGCCRGGKPASPST
jgi:cytochrome c oxidase subunit IV